MFQYAYAMRVMHVIVDKRICINGLLHMISKDKRSVSLHHFKLAGGTHVCSKLESYCRFVQFLFSVAGVYGISGFLKYVWRLVTFQKTKRDNVEMNCGNVFFTTNAFSTPEVRQVAGNSHIYGGFQSLATVEGIIDELRAAFELKTKPSAENEIVLREIKNSNAVCLHIRRGDYKLFPQLQVCNEKYYATAVQLAKSQLKNPVFYVFSTGREDIEWIKKHYVFDAELRYVDLDNPDYEELRLMMACKHFIISNSTFSWWAAMLSNEAKEQKKVWAPSEWMKEAHVSLVPECWNKVAN